MSDIGVEEFNAWNPGISSQIPPSLNPLTTLYRSENSFVDYDRAQELSDFCGLNTAELISFRVERLAVHELLVRVTSDLSVPDGPNYEDLGINLRSMVKTIYQQYVLPEMSELQAVYDKQVSEARDYIDMQLQEKLFPVSTTDDTSSSHANWLSRLLGRQKKSNSFNGLTEPLELVAIAEWQKSSESESHNLRKTCLDALIKVVNALVAHRGKVLKGPDLIAAIAVNYASNQLGDELVAEFITPLFAEAVNKEHYRVLPLQSKPVVMNVKGASASGKSTIRSQQRQLADKLGIPWEDFALISPDYWRKYLLDYSSVGEHYKYAAMFTGQELEIIDKKLDRYMALKAERGDIPHLLIDRFRFDSFSVANGHSKDSKLLSRFGDRIFMFFMITPPAETVIRAWERGASTGRYKAVDDLLYHNVEAFTGIPALFFSWVKTTDKQVHFEFLDNDVPKGDLPKSIAFGWNNSMTILNIDAMCDIDRFRKVNVDAKNAEQVFKDDDATEDSDFEFLKKCIRQIKEVLLADANTTQVYAGFKNGSLVWIDKHYLEAPTADKKIRCLLDLFPLQSSGQVADDHRIDVVEEKKFTLGDWGPC